MRRIRFLVEKEFKQLFRNKVLLRMMLAAPVMQLILLSYAANFEVKDLKIAVVDGDQSTFSRRLVSKFRYIDNFRFLGYLPAHRQASQLLLRGQADLILVIPPDFEKISTGIINLPYNCWSMPLTDLRQALPMGMLPLLFGTSTRKLSWKPSRCVRSGAAAHHWESVLVQPESGVQNLYGARHLIRVADSDRRTDCGPEYCPGKGGGHDGATERDAH